MTKKKRRQKEEPIDWYEIRKLMLRSFTGTRLTDVEMKLAERAIKADSKRYEKLHREVKEGEISRIRQSGA